jgi:arabinogalactan oligomer/maltooligosaccharide transport system permease protein
MFQKDTGFINAFLMDNGLITSNINWMGQFPLTNIIIIVINMWVGIPYTMLICTGILMNVPDDLYESARIDGASPFKMYTKITLPYMLFITGPYLISSFVGNINNFNVIYLLSGGEPKFLPPIGAAYPQELVGLGQTDLLITWIYKITTTNNPKNYGLASVLGVFVFIIVAVLSLILYSRSSAVKNEEDFQ